MRCTHTYTLSVCKQVAKIACVGCMLVLCHACAPKNTVNTIQRDFMDILKSDTLRAVTVYGSTSYFYFQDEPMGYDYELCRDFAKYLGVNLAVKIAPTKQAMLEMLAIGEADLIIYNCAQTNTISQQMQLFPTHQESEMVLVQRMGKKATANVTDLQNKKITVVRNSRFHERLKMLNEEIGGGIRIVLAPDSLSEENLIEQVSAKEIDFTVAYRDLAALHKHYNPQLNTSVTIGFPQSRGWLLRKQSTELQDVLRLWWNGIDDRRLRNMQNRYWNKNKYLSAQKKVQIPIGAISPYDHLFKQYAPEIDWDWRLLASLCYHESRFDSTVVSPMGAIGLMQLMPITGAKFGLNENNRTNPEANIAAGVQYIKYLKMVYRHITDTEERKKFILASYNAGPAHILDAMSLAEKYGKNPHVWYDNVEYFLLKKREAEFYNDPVVKYGYFNGNATRKYVQNVMETYQKYLARQ